MTHRIVADRTDTGQGPRVREFARIARAMAARSSDPKVMALARGRAAATKPLARYTTLERRAGR